MCYVICRCYTPARYNDPRGGGGRSWAPQGTCSASYSVSWCFGLSALAKSSSSQCVSRRYRVSAHRGGGFPVPIFGQYIWATLLVAGGIAACTELQRLGRDRLLVGSRVFHQEGIYCYARFERTVRLQMYTPVRIREYVRQVRAFVSHRSVHKVAALESRWLLRSAI